jgi:Fe-Mn family superoxide dismutase
MENTKNSIDRRKFLTGVGLSTAALISGIGTGCSKVSNPFSKKIKIGDESTDNLYPIYKDGQYQVKDFSRLLGDENLGLSKANIENHLGLYKKYVLKVNAAEKNLKEGFVDDATLKNLAFSLNGMALHDIYFTNMNSEKSKPSKALKKAIEKSFGSFDAYMKNLIAIASKVDGWSITGINLLNGQILNYGEDTHSSNFPNYVLPILALDVYEHAYTIDFGSEGKNKYLGIYPNIIDWDVVSLRFDTLKNKFAA